MDLLVTPASWRGGDESRRSGAGAELDESGGRISEGRRGGDHHQPAQRDREQPEGGGADGGDRLPALAGFEVEHSGSYPGWKPEPNSEIVRKLQAAHEELFGEPAKLIAMHAGLECGVIGEKYPGMQMISFGPTIVDPHSPERAGADLDGRELLEVPADGSRRDLTISDHLPASAAWRPAW